MKTLQLNSWSRNLKWTMVGEIFGKGAVFITSIIVARTLGANGLGIIAAAQAFAAYLWMGADLGVNFYGAREVAKNSDRREKIISSLFGLRVISGFIAMVAGITAAIVVFEVTSVNVYIAASIQVLFLALTLDWALRGTQNFRVLARVGMIGGGLLVVGSLGVAWAPVSTFNKIPMFVAVGACSQAVMAGFAFWGVHIAVNGKLMPTCNDLCSHLKKSLIFSFSSSVVAAAQFLPIVVLNHFGGSEVTGVFSAPYRLVLTFITATYMIISSAFPILSQYYSKDINAFYRQFYRMRIIVLGVSGVIFLILLFFSDIIIKMLFGTAFKNSVPVLSILSFLVPIVSLRGVYGTALLASGGERLHLCASSFGLLFWLAAGFPLILRFGINWIAWICLASEGIIVTGMACAFHRRIYLRGPL